MNKNITVETKREKLERELLKLEVYERIRNSIVNDMQWDAMEYHSADDEHENSWFEAPKEDGYNYNKYTIYEDILTELDNLFLGK